MAKWNSINDFEIPSDSYISQFTSAKDLLIDLMGEDFYEEFKRDVTEHCEPKMWEECSNINSYLSKEWGSWSLWNFFIKDYFYAYLAECQDNKNQSK